MTNNKAKLTQLISIGPAKCQDSRGQHSTCWNIAARVMLAKMRHTGGTTRDVPVVANRRRLICAAPICPARIASGWKSLLHPRLRTVSLSHTCTIEPMQLLSPRTQLQPSSVTFEPCVSYIFRPWRIKIHTRQPPLSA